MPRRRRTIRLPNFNRRQFVGGSIVVAATTAALPKLPFAQDRQLNVYNWDTYIGETTVEDFSEETGVLVRYDLFASNDELFAKLREGNPGYDVIFPSNDYLERMIAAEMVVPLEHSKIPNMANIDEAFVDPGFDPGRKYSVPYMWGTIGIGYRMGAAEPAPKRWSDLLQSDVYAGRIALMNDSDIVQVALKMLGYSGNSKVSEEIAEAGDALVAAKPNIKTFAPDTGQDLLISGEVDVVMEWSGDIQQVIEEDPELAYIVPEEGGLLWEDDMCIPKDAPHPEEAHEWINYILTPEVHAGIADYIKYACPNAAALPLISAEDRENPAIYPPREILDRCEVSFYKGEEIETLYEEALTRALAA